MHEKDKSLQIAVVFGIIANQIALNANEALKETSAYKVPLKNKLDIVIRELLEIEKNEYDVLEGSVQYDSINIAQDVQYNLTKLISELGIYSFGEIELMLLAYKENKQLMLETAFSIVK